jgi:hypothetical protein
MITVASGLMTKIIRYVTQKQISPEKTNLGHHIGKINTFAEHVTLKLVSKRMFGKMDGDKPLTGAGIGRMSMISMISQECSRQ